MSDVRIEDRDLTDVEGALARAAERLAEATAVALACHVNPDPDAAGSMLGLAHHLASLGKEVVCSWGNQPLERPPWLHLLDGDAFLVEPAGFPRDPEVMVTLDTAARDRLGTLAANADRAGELIVIDHHRTNPGFGTITVLDPDASSTAELVVRLVRRLGGELPPQAAACLYAGILADTGRFQYGSASPDTLRTAADLREHPFDHVRLGQALYERSPLGYLRVLAVALDRLVHDPDASLLWTYVTQADVTRASIAMADTDDLIDVVRVAEEADVACVLKQQADGWFKVSLRSRGGTDVGAVAQSFGGGGHRLAAGYTSTTGVSETIAALTAALAAPGR